MVDYNEAVMALNVDLGEAAIRDEVKWTTQASVKAGKTSPDNISLTSKALSRLANV